MRTREKDRLLSKLLKKRDDIKKEIQYFEENQRLSAEETSGEVSRFTTHAADMSAISQEREKAFMLASHQRELLLQVNAAIEKLESESYGICELCGDKITLERLSLLPYTKFCMKCQIEMENRGVKIKK